MKNENKSNIFERMMSIARDHGYKNANDLAKALGYRSPEKLYRLERYADAKPSVDILADFSNLFENINLAWVLTGRKAIVPDSTPVACTEENMKYGTSEEPTRIASAQHDVEKTLKNAKTVPPTAYKIVPPTVPPTLNLGAPKVVVIDHDDSPAIALVQGRASAGYLNGYADPEYIHDLPTLKIPGLKEASHRAFEVKGHSMTPTLHDRCIVIGCWVESLDDVRDRRIYIVVTKEQGITVKRVLNRIFDRNTLVCMSDNSNKQEYPNFTIDPEDILELWELKAALQFEFTEIGELYTRFNNLEANMTIMQEQIRHLLK